MKTNNRSEYFLSLDFMMKKNFYYCSWQYSHRLLHVKMSLLNVPRTLNQWLCSLCTWMIVLLSFTIFIFISISLNYLPLMSDQIVDWPFRSGLILYVCLIADSLWLEPDLYKNVINGQVIKYRVNSLACMWSVSNVISVVYNATATNYFINSIAFAFIRYCDFGSA